MTRQQKKPILSSKTLKAQLLSVIAMLVVASVALSSATYAWFVNNATVEINTLQFKASTSTSLLVAVQTKESATGNTVRQDTAAYTTYKNVLTNDDITTAGGWTDMFTLDAEDYLMQPASTTDENILTELFFIAEDSVDATTGKVDMFRTADKTAVKDIGEGAVKRIPLSFYSPIAMNVYFTNVDDIIPIAAADTSMLTPAELTAYNANPERPTYTADASADATLINAIVEAYIDNRIDTIAWGDDGSAITAVVPGATQEMVETAADIIVDATAYRAYKAAAAKVIAINADMSNQIKKALRMALVGDFDGDGTEQQQIFQFADDATTDHINGAGNNTYYGQVTDVDGATLTAGAQATYDAIEALQNEGTATYPTIEATTANTNGYVTIVDSTSVIPFASMTTYEATVTPGDAGEAPTVAADGKTALFQLNADEAKDITVYLWLEGVDEDCLSQLSNYTFAIDLGFAGKEITAP